MTGGIFPNYPFQINIKCVIFAIIVIFIFFYNPPKMNLYWEIFVSLILFVVAYVAMAWYDYKFDCRNLALKRSSGSYSITKPFKPPIHIKSQITSTKTKKEERLEKFLIHFYHLLIITPLLLYIGINKNNTPQFLYTILIANICFAIAYHAQILWRRPNAISWGHVIVGILLIYLSFIHKKPIWYFYTLLGLGLFVAVTHAYGLIKLSH
jgi:hypothetical protein